MSYKVETIQPFRKELKKLIKKYPSLKSEIAELGQQLSEDPTNGISLGNNCYKIRLAIKSKGKGKPGEARVLTHVVHVSEQIVYLLSIYDKSDQESISNKEIEDLLRFIQ